MISVHPYQVFWQSRTLIHIEVIQEMKWINSLFDVELFLVLKFSSSNRRCRLCIHKTLFPYHHWAKIFLGALFFAYAWKRERIFLEFIIDSNRVRRLFNHFCTHSNLFAFSIIEYLWKSLFCKQLWPSKKNFYSFIEVLQKVIPILNMCTQSRFYTCFTLFFIAATQAVCGLSRKYFVAQSD